MSGFDTWVAYVQLKETCLPYHSILYGILLPLGIVFKPDPVVDPV
jgi:hypothetical protein